MSTRSNISIKRKDGTYDKIYCHSDGYLEYNGRIYYGFGANTDIIAASVEAYIDCINKFKE